jgi:Tol biopolymer transport system component
MISRRKFLAGVPAMALTGQMRSAMAQSPESSPAIRTGKKGVLLMNRIGPSSSELYIANADGSGERKILQNSMFEYNASFSPDGKSVVFTADTQWTRPVGRFPQPPGRNGH